MSYTTGEIITYDIKSTNIWYITGYLHVPWTLHSDHSNILKLLFLVHMFMGGMVQKCIAVTPVKEKQITIML